MRGIRGMFYSLSKGIKENTLTHKGKRKAKCYICKKEFETMKSGNKFCSDECYQKYLSK